MSRLIWSPPALLDVQRAYRLLAEKNAVAAQRAVKAIRAAVKVIAQYPEIGRPGEETEPEYREWSTDSGGSGYIVLYRHDGRTAVIVAVRHQQEVGY